MKNTWNETISGLYGYNAINEIEFRRNFSTKGLQICYESMTANLAMSERHTTLWTGSKWATRTKICRIAESEKF